MYYIFTYGTLKDKEFQRELFDRELNMEEATLYDYEVYSDNDGYFFIEKSIGHEIVGNVIEVSLSELNIIEQWEETPKYYRKNCNVILKSGDTKKVDVYFKRNYKEKNRIEGSTVTTNDRNEVIKDIRKLINSRNSKSYPESDMMLVFSGILSNENNINKNFDCPNEYLEDFFLKHMNETLKIEYVDSFSQMLSRKYIGSLSIKCNDYEQFSDVYISVVNELRVASILFNIPNIVIDPIDLAEKVCAGSTKVIFNSTEYSLEDLFNSYGIKIVGSPRFISFLPNLPNKKDMADFLAGEKTPLDHDVTAKTLSEPQNIGVYNSSEIYGSEKSLIIRQKNYLSNYMDRAQRQTLTYFICELLAFQDALINKTNLIIERIIQHKEKYDCDFQVEQLEELIYESSKGLVLWNTRNFKYTTAKILAENISQCFGIKEMLEAQERNKQRIEQLLSIRVARINEHESKSINLLLVLLTILQVAPVIYSIIMSVIDGKFYIKQIYASSGSLLVCIILLAIFRIRLKIKIRNDKLNR